MTVHFSRPSVFVRGVQRLTRHRGGGGHTGIVALVACIGLLAGCSHDGGGEGGLKRDFDETVSQAIAEANDGGGWKVATHVSRPIASEVP